MEKTEINIINLPEGSFGIDHNCATCRYADYSDTDSYGRVHCCGNYGGYNNPKDRNGCFWWAEG